MKVNIMPCRYPLKSNEWPMLSQVGFAKHGDVSHFTRRPDDSDVHMFWGTKRSYAKQVIGLKKKVLVIERAYLGDRFQWFMLGFDGLNGFANFCNKEVEHDRWLKYWAHEMKPYDRTGDYALVIGQVQGDASLSGTDAYKWACQAVADARKKYNKVVYRPHPLERNKRKIEGAEYDTGSLADSLKNAKVVITFSSNTGVDAIMAGKSVVAYNPCSMVYDLAAHSVNEDFTFPDRSDWGRKIAYAQWLPHEIKDGTAWGHLRKHVRG
jgi:hypothetical protein